MNKETIKENYPTFSTEELIEIVSEVKSLNPEFIPLLQNELIKRNENGIALSITEYLTSIKYHIPESILFDSILNHRKKGLLEKEIDIKLEEEHGIDSDYADLMRISLKGKENIGIGIAMIIVPLILGIILLTMRTFIGIFPLILIGVGIWKVNKGIMQKKENN